MALKMNLKVITGNLWLCYAVLLCSATILAQPAQNDSAKINYEKIYAWCLDGNVSPALKVIRTYDGKELSAKDEKFKDEFEDRFAYNKDKSNYLHSRASAITDLLSIYVNYWRKSCLDNGKNFDSLLLMDVSRYLAAKYPPAVNLKANEDSIDVYLKKYIRSLGLFTTGFGKTGEYYDLLVWKNQQDTTYKFRIYGDRTSVEVVFMNNFITHGWEEYATLGRAYPGGWATKNALYCVKSAYDLKSENFRVSYLAHESRHFSDYKIFPDLSSADLEYRAKLTELSLAQKTLYKTIDFFIDNANYDSENGHSVADYCVIRDLSKALFNENFVKDKAIWKKISTKQINETAYSLLKKNTKALKKLGPGVKNYIKQ